MNTDIGGKLSEADKDQPNKTHWYLWTILFSLIYLFLIGYIDFDIIKTKVLPKDYCYYHTHKTPFWVEWLYMNGASNGHPDGSFPHLILLFIFCIFLGIRTGKYLTRNLDIRDKQFPKI